MNIYTDKPIEKHNQDLLGRSTFSKHLGEAIYNYDNKDSLVIGLYGKWGTGKTSVVNMAIKTIEDLSRSNENKPIIMNFSPWNYADKSNLISIFFKSLSDNIDIQANKNIKEKLGEKLILYKDTLDILSFIPTIGPLASQILKSGADYAEKNINKVPSLEKTKTQIEKILSESKQKIIVIIDDIDRLTNTQIRDIFQLVKQVGDFSNIIYVLLMDKEIVARALREVHNTDGSLYLEKIIQVPFEIPELSKTSVEKLFVEKVDGIISNEALQNLNIKYWDHILQYCINPYLNTLRDVNRVLNSFQFKYYALQEETCFVDLLAISTLEVLNPKLYRWISDNKIFLCGNEPDINFLTITDSPDYKSIYIDEFTRLGLNPEISSKSIASLFPKFNSDINAHYSIYESSSELRYKNRIAHCEKFDLYFSFDLSSVKVPKSRIKELVLAYNKEELIIDIEKINDEGNIKYFLYEIESMIDIIPYDRLKLVTTSIILTMGKLKNSNFIRSENRVAEKLVFKLLKKLDAEDERFEILISTLENINVSGLGFMSAIINKIQHAYARVYKGDEILENQIIYLDQLEEFEKLFLDKIYNELNSDSIFNILEIVMFLRVREIIDKNGQIEYINKLLESEYNKLLFICALSQKWYGDGDEGWTFYDNIYLKYISDDEVYSAIDSWGKHNLDEFTNEEQSKLASFALSYKSENDDYISLIDANMLVQKWASDSY